MTRQLKSNQTQPEERLVPMRLQKFLARAGAASRRGSENLMTAGRVTVNGQVVTELGSKVDPLVDQVAVDGVPVRLEGGPVTIMLHKPAGYVTTMSDPQGRPTVAELVPTDRFPGLFPIGRWTSTPRVFCCSAPTASWETAFCTRVITWRSVTWRWSTASPRPSSWASLSRVSSLTTA